MTKMAQYEFLPAVLEIQEKPPSPIGRAILWSIVVLFALALTWACIGKVDIVAVAQGHIVPSQRTKLIQPLEIGTIHAIHVQDGQQVHKGDVLIEFDATSTEADETRVEQEYATAQAEVARSGALVAAMQAEDSPNGEPESRWPDGIRADILEPQKQLLKSQWAEYQARVAALTNEHTRHQAELAGTDELIKKLEGTLPLITERARALKGLADKQLAPRQDYLEIEQQRIEQTQDLAAKRQHRKEIIAALAQNRQKRRSYEAEALNKTLAELADAKRRCQGLEQESIKASRRTHLQHLTAPVDGVVQQLAVHTIGGVVTPAQQLMVIVPGEDKVEIEAVIANKDIGFVHEGQSAEVKVDAFPFTKYGTLAAELLSVSTDAVQDEKRGLIFMSRVLLKESAIRVEDKLIELSPGMAVTVEVKTGQRRLIEYLLSPLLQYVDESVRER
jgi:membrane fusion protein, hemolysin D